VSASVLTLFNFVDLCRCGQPCIHHGQELADCRCSTVSVRVIVLFDIALSGNKYMVLRADDSIMYAPRSQLRCCANDYHIFCIFIYLPYIMHPILTFLPFSFRAGTAERVLQVCTSPFPHFLPSTSPSAHPFPGNLTLTPLLRFLHRQDSPGAHGRHLR
jgi:hypothetical protein